MILKNIDRESFDKVEQEFLSNSDYRSLQIIMDHKGIFYPTEDQKKELLDKMKSLFNADGDYSRIEKTLMMFLEKLL